MMQIAHKYPMDQRERLVVVGGGTAGWIAALSMLKHRPHSEVTVIESEDIGILGAGEGTTPFIHSFLNYVGISFADLVKNCGATVKLGIRFEDWLGDGTDYFHGFLPDENLRLSMRELDQWLKTGGSSDSVNFCDYLSKQHKSCFSFHTNSPENVRDPMETLIPHSTWSMHFDARLLADYFRRRAVERGCLRREGRVVEIVQAESGRIKELVLADHTRIDTDFVFDCTGFRRLIMGQTLQTPWISYRRYLGLDRALGFPLEITEPARPETRARAMPNGWLWQIPLQHRWGTGYVFSTAHTTDSQAVLDCEAVLGRKIPEVRAFDFEAGVLESVLKENCLALGLSQGFVEPLEATSIWITLSTMDDFIDSQILDHNTSVAQQRFNRRYRQRQEQVLEFLRLHYITPRRDTAFWQSVAYDWQLTPELDNTIELLKEWLPSRIRDYDLFPHNSWVQVMAGLGLLGKGSVRRPGPLDQRFQRTARQCLTIPELLQACSAKSD